MVFVGSYEQLISLQVEFVPFERARIQNQLAILQLEHFSVECNFFYGFVQKPSYISNELMN